MVGFAIVDVEGTSLSQEERELMQHPSVVGIILFTKNYKNREQLIALTKDISKTRSDLFIAVDQEGGRVQRFVNGFTRLPSMRHWGELYKENPDETKTQLKKITQTMINELHEVGIHLSLLPVLDIDHGVSKIIGERSFGPDPKIVAELAEVVIDTMHASGMPSTGKHFPGHGGVAADSHVSLPNDYRQPQAIDDCDLVPFFELSAKLDAVMPAHVIYKAFDPNPAGFSPYWLEEILRKRIKFNGIVISDDLTMEGAALMGDYPTRAKKALMAGCDLISICNNREGAVAVLDALDNYHNPSSQKRVETFIRKML